MRFSDYYETTKFLSAADLNGPTDLEIQNVTEQTFDNAQGQQIKLKLTFANHRKQMILNTTNARTLRDLFSDDTDAWVGQWMTAFPSTTEYAGRQVDCVRIRPEAPNKKRTA